MIELGESQPSYTSFECSPVQPPPVVRLEVFFCTVHPRVLVPDECHRNRIERVGQVERLRKRAERAGARNPPNQMIFDAEKISRQMFSGI